MHSGIRLPSLARHTRHRGYHLVAAGLCAWLLAACSNESPPPTSATGVLAGTVTAAVGTVTDSDTNDPEADLQSNDSPGTAQPLPNPVLLGGFLSRSGSGSGVFAAQGDTTDIFRAVLAEGQTVTLFISDHDSANPYAIDFDLELHRATTTSSVRRPIASSVSAASATEAIAVPESGTYHIVVKAVRGASNYLLSIGQPAFSPLVNAPFVPGEIIVRYHDTLMAASAGESLASAAGLRRKKGQQGRPILYALKEEKPVESGMASLSSPQAAAERLRSKTLATLEALRRQPEVASADLNYIRQPAALPSDKYYPLQWSLALLNLPQAWDAINSPPGAVGNEVIVAVIDTGVFLAHPDLQSSLLDSGYDFISNPATAGDGDGIDGNPDDPGDGTIPLGSSFHGTHVAGIIAADTDNARGIAGITWGTHTRIMPIRVLGRGGGTSYDIIQGVRYAAGLSNDSGTIPPRRADIINLSLGGPGFSMTEQAEYNAVRNAGVIVVAAAGNNNSNLPSYPAAYDGVVSVAAVTRGRQRASYSNFGLTVDVTAPGGDTAADADGDGYPDGILGTLAENRGGNRRGTYGIAQGTSMAAPHVAGVAAIMKALDPSLTPARFMALLEDGRLTTDLGVPGWDELYGHGLLNALKAVQATQATLPPVIAVEPPGALEFGPFANRLSFTTRNAGDGEFSIVAVKIDASWLRVTPSSLDGGEGTFTALVDRSGLPDGLHRATITLEADRAAPLQIPVVLQVGEGPDKGDTGHLYFLLVDPDSGETLHTVHAGVTDGRYHFRFEELAPGNYFLIAGSDRDNDGLICDPGEACGGYPTIERLQPIHVQEGMKKITLTTRFPIVLEALETGNAPATGPQGGFSRVPSP